MDEAPAGVNDRPQRKRGWDSMAAIVASLIGFLALGVVPSLAQFAGMLVVLVGFHVILRR